MDVTELYSKKSFWWQYHNPRVKGKGSISSICAFVAKGGVME